MKRVTLTFPKVNSSPVYNNNETFKAIFESLDESAMLAHIHNTFQLIQNGDIWFIHDAATEDNLGLIINFILDSDDALNEFNETSLPGWIAAGAQDPVVNEITFEEFATFAAENEETTFSPFETFNIVI